MGCDIHVHAERKEGDRWVHVEVPLLDCGHYKDEIFGGRQYGKFGFMAGVRNYSAITPLSEPRGVPDDASDETRSDYESWDMDAHSASWLSLQEMEAVNYEQSVEDRRCMRNGNGGSTCDPGEGEQMTLRQFLETSDYFESLKAAKDAKAERIVFWFDN